MIKIRKSRPDEGNRAFDIWRSAVDATHDFLTLEDRFAIEREVEASLPTAPFWLAVTEDDYPVGFMIVTDGHMDSLFIDADYRGIGVGRALVEYALVMHPGLTTDVNEQNVQAVAFYERMGFVRVGRSGTDEQGRPYPLIHLRQVSGPSKT